MALTLGAHVIMVDTIFFCVETRDYSGNQNDQKINSSSISDVLGVQTLGEEQFSLIKVLFLVWNNSS